jgi:ribosomal subunit interface protein
MSVRVTFVNFPVSEKVKNIIADKIDDSISRFGEQIEAARVIFSEENHIRHVRLLLQGGGKNLTVHAEGNRMGRALDSAIDKLSGALRKKSSKAKHKMHSRDCDAIHAKGKRSHRGHGMEPLNENAFDRFEKEYVREFEEAFDKAS